MFFRLASWELALLIVAIVMGFAVLGLVIGRQLRKHSETLREPVGAVQGALLALVGLILAFGLTMAVGRHDSRRAAVVDETNAIGTTYLRAQTLAEPMRTRSLDLLERYTDTSIRLSNEVPTTQAFRRRSPKAERSSACSGARPVTRWLLRRRRARPASTSRR